MKAKAILYTDVVYTCMEAQWIEKFCLDRFSTIIEDKVTRQRRLLNAHRSIEELKHSTAGIWWFWDSTIQQSLNLSSNTIIIY